MWCKVSTEPNREQRYNYSHPTREPDAPTNNYRYWCCLYTPGLGEVVASLSILKKDEDVTWIMKNYVETCLQWLMCCLCHLCPWRCVVVATCCWPPPKQRGILICERWNLRRRRALPDVGGGCLEGLETRLIVPVAPSISKLLLGPHDHSRDLSCGSQR